MQLVCLYAHGTAEWNFLWSKISAFTIKVASGIAFLQIHQINAAYDGRIVHLGLCADTIANLYGFRSQIHAQRTGIAENTIALLNIN